MTHAVISMQDDDHPTLIKSKDASIKVVTFGCRLNTYESEVMKNLANDAGLKDAILVNTCAVTKEAERQARQSIRKLKRDNPNAKIIVTGCSAQINPTQYSDMEEVDRVLGNEEKMRLESYQNHERILVNDIMAVKETATHLISGFEGKVRAFVQIQNGCNHRCTFCTIPFGRGNSRSVPLGEIVTQIKILLQNGYKEIVLTGVDITDYGGDLPAKPTLGQTLKRLFILVPELMRLRLSSLDPVEVDEDLWDLIAHEKRLMPHLHLSLQAGDDLILKRMKRRHLRHDVVDFCKRARSLRPDAVFGADIIAGFPTENDTMFHNTLNIVEECDLTHLHVFPYSKRPGTPAARMPQVQGNVIKERAARLRHAGQRTLQRYLQAQIGKTHDVLIEEKRVYDCPNTGQKTVQFMGKTDTFVPVTISSLKVSHVEEGEIVTLLIDGVEGDRLIAHL